MKGKEVYTTFTKDNVCAILAALKWQTRRAIKPQPRIYTAMHRFHEFLKWKDKIDMQMPFALEFLKRYCPWQPDDMLCVKEGYKVAGICGYGIHGHYLADDEPFDVQLSDAEWKRWSARKYPYRATSARFMYRSLCRIKQPVVRSWVERARDINEEDAIAEGVEQEGAHWKCYSPGCGCYGKYTAQAAFDSLWHAAYPQFPPDSNPWIWATEFERRAQ